MDQPPGNSESSQPQDLSSTCSLPTVIDLTRNGEECLLRANSMEALRVVKPPSWYPNSGSNKGLPFPGETDSRPLQAGDQIQPDNAFSNTTVTLSYVSRSHVFSTHDTLSQHSPLYGVPSISKFSLHPSDKGVGETGGALCMEMDQHYLQQVDGPLDLASQSELFQSISSAQVASEAVAGVCLVQQSHEISGGCVATNGVVDKCKPQQRGMEHSLSQDTENHGGLLNGSSWSNSGICVESSAELLTTDMAERQKRDNSEVLFLISRTEEPVAVQDSRSHRTLCSLSREYISPLEDPVSPSATSLDDVEEVFILPQTSSSPSAENSFGDEAADTSWDELERGGPGLLAGQGKMSDSDGNTPRLDTSNVYQQPVHTRKTALEPVVDCTGVSTVPEVLEKQPKENDTTQLNGNVRVEQKICQRKKLPPRIGRGTRLEAIVMNINPNWYKVSSRVRAPKKTKASQTQTIELKAVSPKKETSPVRKNEVQEKASHSERETKLKATIPLKGEMESINTDTYKESTSDSENTSFSKYPHNSTSPKTSSPPSVLDKESEHMSCPDVSPEVDLLTISPPSEACQKSPAKHKGKSKASPTAKTKATHAPKRKRKKHQPGPGQSSMFSPIEPEIKLKYVNYKEEKRELRVDNFSPFIHVERKQSSPPSCTVINYPEEEKPRLKGQQKGQQQQHGGFIPGAIPTTSCLQLGRVSTQRQYHSTLVCCLCGRSANAMDLGDLHGPYYPEGYRPSAKIPTRTLGLKGQEEEEEEEDGYSDSDSSCSVRGRGRKCALPPGARPHGPGPWLKQKALLGNNHRWTSDSDPSGSPAAKQARTEPVDAADAADAAVPMEDWYSPPVVPLEPCEYWLHEDCSIWSAGVFLVKGKVYGLEEAVKVAHETMCTRCHETGATLGCFFKGCPNKYHYRCSLQSDCVLNEENFSMKCTKHKNKSFKGSSGNRRDSR